MSVATKPVKRAKAAYPGKREMNLHYKPDRTTKPATVALYVLFVLALLLAAAKFLIYDPLMDLESTRQELARVEAVKADYDARLEEYPEVKRQYQLYAATDEELSQTDRMEVLELVDRVILKELKTAKEQVDTCPDERAELKAEYQANYNVIAEFAPHMMSAEEVKAYIETELAEVLAGGNKGQVMKAAMGALKGKADGKMINEIVTQLCK